MTLRFHPAPGIADGNAARLLRLAGVQVVTYNEDGSCDAEVSEAQLAQFQLKGSAHRVERLDS